MYRVIEACVICSCSVDMKTAGETLFRWVAGCEVEFLRYLAHLSVENISLQCYSSRGQARGPKDAKRKAVMQTINLIRMLGVVA